MARKVGGDVCSSCGCPLPRAGAAPKRAPVRVGAPDIKPAVKKPAAAGRSLSILLGIGRPGPGSPLAGPRRGRKSDGDAY